jgi:hypothetical protein
MGNKIQFPMAIGSEVAVPMKPPYVILPKPKADAVLSGKVDIKFPEQCAWCGSEAVNGLRWVQLYEANPGYKSRGQRLLQEGAALAIGAVAGEIMDSGVGGLMTYGALSAKDAAKVKGLALSIAVPHCVEHTDTSHEGALGLVGNHIQVYDAEYARVIARINNPTINLPTLTGLVWPQLCVVCGTPDANKQYRVQVPTNDSTTSQDESIEAPICANDLKKFIRVDKANNIILLTGLLVAIGLGGLTFMVNAGFVMHLVLCTGGGLLGGLLWIGVLLAMATRLFGVKSLEARPVSVALKDDDQYLLEFLNAETAEAVRQVNGLTTST